jgi:hypothetical protein
MRRRHGVSSLVGALVLVACTDPTGSSPAAPGVYQYEARDAANRPLIIGTFRFDPMADSILSGTWSTVWAPGADRASQVGPQVGDGTLAGVIRRDSVYLTLTPAAVDNNIDLAGTRGSATFGGAWQWITIAGPRTAGSFTLRRR